MATKQSTLSRSSLETITKTDLLLINNLSARQYSQNKLLSNASASERQQLQTIIYKLKNIAEYFSQKYRSVYGPYETCVTTGNHIAIGGEKLKRIWSGIYKGAPNKQYGAQISFVMNPIETCLEVGFYFGSASGHNLNKDERLKLEAILDKLGLTVANAVENNMPLKSKFDLLFDFGFKAYSKGDPVLSQQWLDIIKKQPKRTYISSKIYPNDFDLIENSVIDSYVSQIIFFLSTVNKSSSKTFSKIVPKTPEQLAMEAFRLAEIGLKGERYIMKCEEDRLNRLGLLKMGYPHHKSLVLQNYQLVNPN